MKLEDINPGVVVWNKWEYSIMGRDTDTESTYLIILEVGEIKEVEDFEKKGRKYNQVTCKAKGININSQEKDVEFDDQEIDKG